MISELVRRLGQAAGAVRETEGTVEQRGHHERVLADLDIALAAVEQAAIDVAVTWPSCRTARNP